MPHPGAEPLAGRPRHSLYPEVAIRPPFVPRQDVAVSSTGCRSDAATDAGPQGRRLRISKDVSQAIVIATIRRSAMLMRKGVQYTLVILGLLSASAAHAVGEGTGLLKGCKLQKVQLGHQYANSASMAPLPPLVEGPCRPCAVFFATISCHQAVTTPVWFTSWGPSGARSARQIHGGLKQGSHAYPGTEMGAVMIGPHNFEISTQSQQRGRHVESKLGGGITLEADPTPCPRKIKPPRTINYGI